MTQTNRSPMVVAIMIIAAIYVVMLIGLTRSSYFVGGAALERTPQRFEVAAASRIVPAPARARPVCLALEAKLAEPQDCARVPRPLHQVIQWQD